MKRNFNHNYRMNIVRIIYGIQKNINLSNNKSVKFVWIHNFYI